MADTILQQIINAIDTQLKTIVPSTYQTSLGLNVSWNRDTDNNPIQEMELSGIIVNYSESEKEFIAFQAELHTLQLTIKTFALTDTNIKDKMMADIILAMDNSDDETWGGLADDTIQLGNVEFQNIHTERKIESISMNYEIMFQTQKNDPNNAP